jgi:hypothetical protein
MHEILDHAFVMNVSSRMRVEPRYESMMGYIDFIQSRPASVLSLVKRVTIVGQALGAHEYGDEWAWEQLALEMGEDPQFSLEDQKVMHEIAKVHAYQLWRDQKFIATGRYRHLLTYILKSLPNLSEIVVGKLKPGEQIRGWRGDELMKQLSFYGRKGFDTTFIFYSDWMYDEKHQVISSFIDEFGDRVQPDDAGPQATFVHDLDAAMEAARLSLDIIRLHGYCCCDELPGWYHVHSTVRCECRFTDPVERFQLTLADKDCSFCDEPCGIDVDPFYDTEANVFSYEIGYVPNRIY